MFDIGTLKLRRKYIEHRGLISTRIIVVIIQKIPWNKNIGRNYVLGCVKRPLDNRIKK